jgi:hypothetical protein
VHDWLPPVPHGDIARHLVHRVPVCMLSGFPTHRSVVKQIFRYLKHTHEFGIWYSTCSSLDLVGFSDADFAGCGCWRS